MSTADAVGTTPPLAGAKALLIAAYDSQLKWCVPIARELTARGMTCTFVAPSDLKSALSEQQIADAGVEEVQREPWDRIVASAARSDVVVCSLAGPLVQRLCHDLAATGLGQEALVEDGMVGDGPVLVSGWVGIIIEKITAGYLDRACTDVVAVNSGADLAHFRTVADALGFGSDHLVLTGLPFLSAAPAPRRHHGPPRTVLWADQPTVPAAPGERRHLYDRLADYARRHPDREVLLRPRHRPGEDTFHRMKHHPEDLLEGVELPPNLRIDYTPIAQVLDRVDLLLTVSSTACLEAMDAGIDVALVADLGVHERYGNQVFLDSGLLRTFEQVEADDVGVMSDSWRESYFGGRDCPPAEALADRVDKLLATGERPSRAVWQSSYVRGVWATRDAVRRPAPPRRRPTVGSVVRGARTRAGHAVRFAARRLPLG